MAFNQELKNIKIMDVNLRWIEIYKMTNKINNKVYIGQAVSHRKCNNIYYPHGMEGRFKGHHREALRQNHKYHCNALNNAIITHGFENFELVLLCTCSTEQGDIVETNEIKNHNSLVPNGYNICTSYKSLLPSLEFRTKVSHGNMLNNIKSHLNKFNDFIFNDDECNFDKYITPRTRNKIQVGWYLRINKKVIEFNSSIDDIDTTKKRAIDFLKMLKERK